MKVNRIRRGFTIIEVVLVLAVSGLLLVGMIAGTGSAVARHRYNDSVSSFRDFLQQQYSYVARVQNESGSRECPITSDDVDDPMAGDQERGRTNCLIYGRLLEFGKTDPYTVDITTVVGIAPPLTGDGGAGGVTQQVCAEPGGNTHVVTADRPCNDGEIIGSVNVGTDIVSLWNAQLTRLSAEQGGASTFTLEWGASLVQRKIGNASLERAKGAILIVRAPISGTIRTFINMEEPGAPFSVWPGEGSGELGPSAADDPDQAMLNPNFQLSHADFCIDSDDIFAISGALDSNAQARQRRLVRILPNGSNASAVELLPLDLAEEADRCFGSL